jgi:hypothetical protein
MKNILALFGLIMIGFFCPAQSFFYIQCNQVTEKPVREQLIKASQYVTHSPLSSDYIIQADADVETGSGVLNLQMTVQDSITSKMIFQSKASYTLSSINTGTRLFLRMTIAGFIDKNIHQVIACTREDRYDQKMKFLKSRKDKT